MRTEVTAFGHEYSTDGLGLALALSAAAVAFVALSLALLLPARDRRGAGLGWLAVIALAYGLVALGMPVWAWLGTADPYFGGGEPRSYRVFRSLLERQIAIAALASVLGFVASLTARARKVRERFAVGLFVVASGALVLFATREAVELVRVDCLPRIERVGHPFLQVGRPRTLEVELTCGFAEPPPPVEFVAERPGAHELPFSAEAARFAVSRVVTYEAGEERGPARFALKAGRRVVYRRHRMERIAGALSEKRSFDRHDEVVLEVLPPEDEGSIRVFPLRIRFGDEPPELLRVAGWDGALVRIEDDRLVTVLEDPPRGEKLEAFFLPGVCEGEPDSGPPAPARCRKAVNTAAGMSATMMRIFTLGAATYLPERTVFTLDRIEDRAPEGAELAYGPAG